MRRILGCVVGLSVTMFVFGLAVTAKADAAGSKGHEEVIKTLLKAEKLLVHADHDYDGHRAKAAEEVGKALKELGHHHKKAPPVVPGAPGVVVAPKPVVHTGKPKDREPQGDSDSQMRDALGVLQGVLPEITTKHPKAEGNVKHAIEEINIALKLK